MSQKFKYLIACTKKNLFNEGRSCPSCGCSKSTFVARKFLVTALRRCDKCQMLFRTPTTTAQENASFYQEEYSQGFTTDCPTDDVLSGLMERGFAGAEKDYSAYIDVVLVAGGRKGDRLLDFGCSWGYGSWQFAQRGFEVESFEISLPRADFARSKLGVNVHTALADIKGPFDVVFSAHVLEHVPSVKESIEYGMSMLKPNGLFVAFTPNGSEEYRKKNVESWNKLWGIVHPNFLDKDFYERTFAGKSPMIASNPYHLAEIAQWSEGGRYDTSQVRMDGIELLVLVRK